MAVQLWMIGVGAAMMVHAGYAILAEKNRIKAAGLPIEDDFFGPQAFVQVFLGAALAMWGAISDFKPIRIADCKKPRWESLHARDGLTNFSVRARHFRPLLNDRIPKVPQD